MVNKAHPLFLEGKKIPLGPIMLPFWKREGMVIQREVRDGVDWLEVYWPKEDALQELPAYALAQCLRTF